jgi:hypothetical protein
MLLTRAVQLTEWSFLEEYKGGKENLDISVGKMMTPPRKFICTQ